MKRVMEKEYYDAQIKYINEIRSIRHDMQAHMIVLQYYLDSGNYEKAKAYLGDMKQAQEIGRMFLQDTGHDLVNAIINDILSRSTKKIEVDLEGVFPADFHMKAYDVCTLFSNIFSNAREACEKLEHTLPNIKMEIHEKDGKCFIAVQNPIEWKVATSGAGLLTSKAKKEAHGYGTKNMMKVVLKYGGKIDFLITDTSFRVEIIL